MGVHHIVGQYHTASLGETPNHDSARLWVECTIRPIICPSVSLTFPLIHLHTPQTGQVACGYLARCRFMQEKEKRKRKTEFWMKFVHFVRLFLRGRKSHKKCMRDGSRCHIEFASSCRDIGAQKPQRGRGTYQ